LESFVPWDFCLPKHLQQIAGVLRMELIPPFPLAEQHCGQRSLFDLDPFWINASTLALSSGERSLQPSTKASWSRSTLAGLGGLWRVPPTPAPTREAVFFDFPGDFRGSSNPAAPTNKTAQAVF